MDYEEQKSTFLSSLSRGEKLVSDGPIRVTDVTNMSSISGRACVTTEQVAFWTSEGLNPDFTILLDNVDSVEAASDSTHKLSKVDVLHRMNGRLLKTTFFCSSDMGKAILALTEASPEDLAKSEPVSPYASGAAPSGSDTANDALAKEPESPFTSKVRSDFPTGADPLDDGDDIDKDFQWDLEQLTSKPEEEDPFATKAHEAWTDVTESDKAWGEDSPWGSLPFDDSDSSYEQEESRSQQQWVTEEDPTATSNNDDDWDWNEPSQQSQVPQSHIRRPNPDLSEEALDDFFTEPEPSTPQIKRKPITEEQPKEKKKFKLPSKQALTKREKETASAQPPAAAQSKERPSFEESSFTNESDGQQWQQDSLKTEEEPKKQATKGISNDTPARYVAAIAAVLFIFIGTLAANQFGPLSPGTDDFIATTLEKIGAAQSSLPADDVAGRMAVETKLSNDLLLLQIDQNNKMLEMVSIVASLAFSVMILGIVLVAGWWVKKSRSGDS